MVKRVLHGSSAGIRKRRKDLFGDIAEQVVKCREGEGSLS